MKTKILAFLMAVCMAAGVTACTTNTENVESSSTEASGTSEEQSESERSILEYNTLFVISKERIPDDPSLLDEVMEEKFGIVNHWEQVPSSSVSEKLNLLFASNDVPDYAWPVGITPDYPKRYGNDGLLLPLNDYFDQLPDYKALYTDAEWETMLKMESNADGKLYYLPKKNYRKTANAWIYRKSAFDEMGLTFPKTIDELYTVLKTIKENDPDSIPMMSLIHI